jgi:hypothetical protein
MTTRNHRYGNHVGPVDPMLALAAYREADLLRAARRWRLARTLRRSRHRPPALSDSWELRMRPAALRALHREVDLLLAGEPIRDGEVTVRVTGLVGVRRG